MREKIGHSTLEGVFLSYSTVPFDSCPTDCFLHKLSGYSAGRFPPDWRLVPGRSTPRHTVKDINNFPFPCQYVNLFVEVFTRAAQGLGGAQFEVPQLISHSTVELFWVFLTHHVESVSYRSVLRGLLLCLSRKGTDHADAEVVVDDVVRGRVALLGLLLARLHRLDDYLPPVHVQLNGGRLSSRGTHQGGLLYLL